MEARSLRFAATARALGEAARTRGLVAPAFRSPPRIPGRKRSIRRHANGSATVSLVLRDRPWSSVVADMVDGFVAVNPGAEAQDVRDLLWATVEHIDLRADAEARSPTGRHQRSAQASGAKRAPKRPVANDQPPAGATDRQTLPNAA